MYKKAEDVIISSAFKCYLNSKSSHFNLVFYSFINYYLYLYTLFTNYLKNFTVMKKITFLLLIVLFASCGKEPAPSQQLDPNAMIYLRGVPSSSRDTVFGYTPLEVVQNAVNIKWMSHYAGNEHHEIPKRLARTFTDQFKDYEIPALIMWGTDIIGMDITGEDGQFIKDFIYGFNVVITDNHNDTIAYVADETINNARPIIEAAYNRGDYETCYRLFHEVFTFKPYP